MEKGFKKYYKEGFKSSLKALKGFGIFKYQLLMLINLLGTILIFPRPLVSLVNVRVIKNTRINKKISITNSLQSFDHPISFWSLMISKIMTFVLFLGIVLLIALLTSILFFFGLMISTFIGDNGLTAILFSVPGGILLLAFLISIPYIYIPVKYVVDSNPQITFSKTMYNALYSLKQGGKRTIFLNGLVFYSILAGIGTICFMFTALAFSFLPPELMGIAALVLAIMTATFIFVMPMFSLTYSIVKQNLYEDLLVDTYSGVKTLTGINPKIMKNARRNGDIASLFDNIDYDDFIVEEDDEEIEDQLIIDEYLVDDSSKQNEENPDSQSEEASTENDEELTEEKPEEAIEEENSASEDPFEEVLSMAETTEVKPKKSFKDILGKLRPKKKVKEESINNEIDDLTEELVDKPENISEENSTSEDPFDEVLSMAESTEKKPKKSFKDILEKLKPKKKNEEKSIENEMDNSDEETKENVINEEKPKKSFKDILGKLKPKKKALDEDLTNEDKENSDNEDSSKKVEIKTEPKVESSSKEETLKEEIKLEKEVSDKKPSSKKEEIKIEPKEESSSKEEESKESSTKEVDGELLPEEIVLEPSLPDEMPVSPIEDINTETQEEALFDDSQFEEYLSDLLEENSKKVGE